MDLEKVLTEQILSLTPVPYEPEGPLLSEFLMLDGTEEDLRRWRDLTAQHLSGAKRFEIHCWSDEQEAIRLALQHGVVKPFDWKYGTVIEGPVTADFSRLLLDAPKPADCDMGRRLTPFFTINLDHHFSSGHYGTELAWSPLPEE